MNVPISFRVTACALLWLCAPLSACTLERSPLALPVPHADAGAGNGSGAGGAAGAGGNAGATAGSAGSAGSGGQGGSGPGDGDAQVDAGVPPADASLFDAAGLDYEPGTVGAPCVDDSECKADRLDRTCFSEDFFGGLLTLPGGYCGNACDLSAASPCEPGGACITFPSLPPLLACMRACTKDSDCRVAEGYSCNKPFTSTTSVCSLR